MAKKKKGAGGDAATTLAARSRRPHAGVGDAEVTVPKWVPWTVYGVLTIGLFAAFIFSDQMLYGGDTLALGYTARKFYADQLRAGHFPLWNPLLLGGTPFLEALSGGDSLYPSALLLVLMAPFRALGWKLVIHVFLAGVFMFGWTRRLGVSRASALVAGVAYMMAPYFVTLVMPGHDGKMFVDALTPLLFWAMEATFPTTSRPGWRFLPFVGVAGVVALVILTTHFQMAYFLFLAAGCYYAFRCLQQMGIWSDEDIPVTPHGDALVDRPAGRNGPALSRFGLFLAASVLGAAAAGAQLIPAMQYATQLSRRTATTTAATPEQNRQYAAQWSLHPEEAASLVVPEFVGVDTQTSDWTSGTYWGRNAFKGNHEYVGLVVLLLAGVSFFGARRKRLRWFVAAMGVVALLYGMGEHTPVWQIAYAVLPGIKLFRAAGMAIFLFGFAAATLLALGVDRLLELRTALDDSASTRVLRYFWIAAGVLGVGLVLAGTGSLTTIWTSTIYRDIEPDKMAALAADKPFIQRGFVLALLFALATAGLVWAALRGKLSGSLMIAGLAVLVALDCWRVDKPFIQVIDPARVIDPDPIESELLRREKSEPPFRVAEIGSVTADQDAGPATFGIPLAGGHHPNDLARYRELIGMQGSGTADNLHNPNILRLLAIRYIIWPTAQMGSEPQGLPVVARTQIQANQSYQTLLQYPALPRARLVGAAEIVPDDKAVARILEPSFDPAITAILTEQPPIKLPGGPVPGTVQWVEDGADRLHLTVDSPSNALLVVADNWYPAWKATVNGQDAPILRAYYELRAVPIPAGHQDVVLWYDAGFLRAGLLSSGLACAVLLALAIGLFVRERRGEPVQG